MARSGVAVKRGSRCTFHPPLPCRGGVPDRDEPTRIASRAAWPKPSGTSRFAKSVSDSGPGLRPCRRRSCQHAANQTVSGVWVEDGPRRHGCSGVTVRAHEFPVSQPLSARTAAFRTDKPGRPAQPLQVVQAVGVGLEPDLLAKGTGVVNACDWNLHAGSMRPAAVKWIPHTGVIGR